MHDIKFAIRQLAKAPGFALTVIISLAIGIAANATVLCWLRNIVLRPLPGVMKQEQMVVLVSNQGGGCMSLPDLRDVASLDGVFAGTVASQTTPASLRIGNGGEWIFGQVATANFFELLGVRPILGRGFLADEDLKPGGNPVMVIGERLWEKRFGGDRSIIGKTVELNRCAFTIVGVAPKDFPGTMTGLICDFWAPVSMYAEVGSHRDFDLLSRNGRGFHDLARLRPGVTLAQAQAAVQALDASLAQAYPKSNREAHHRVLPLTDAPWGAAHLMGSALWLLLAVSGGVLLIVTANVANLLLARASSRRKEVAIRMSVGASRARLIRQLLTESMLLGSLGGISGALLASRAIQLVIYFLPATNLPVGFSGYTLDGATLGITLLMAGLTALMFGLVPAIQSSSIDIHGTLKEGGRTSASSHSHQRLRQGLVVAEVAIALALLIGAGLCLKGFARARKIDLGLDPERVLTAGLQIGMNGYSEDTGRVFYRQLQERLAATPGVEEATLASWLPLGLAGCKGTGVQVPGYERQPGESLTYEYAVIAPRYFSALHIPLVAGRDFTAEETTNAPRVAIVNEAFAGHFWPGREAIGRKIRCAGEERTVVGVARNGKYNRLNEAPQCFFYLPYQQYVPDLDLSVVVRTRGDPAAFASTLNQVVRGVDTEVAVWGTMTMSDHVGASFFVPRMAAILMIGLGLAALVLAAMGVYAVVAYGVSQRTQEFGIRMGLGARRGDILLQVLRQGLDLVLLGIGLGMALAVVITRLLGSLLYGLSAFDPVVFIGVPVLLATVALLASYLPARRATLLDPMVALRQD